MLIFIINGKVTMRWRNLNSMVLIHDMSINMEKIIILLSSEKFDYFRILFSYQVT
jgi:hypothetical protein